VLKTLAPRTTTTPEDEDRKEEATEFDGKEETRLDDVILQQTKDRDREKRHCEQETLEDRQSRFCRWWTRYIGGREKHDYGIRRWGNTPMTEYADD